jgi:hypothetical protein
MSAAAFRPTAADFAQVVAARQTHVLSRPSLSYWQDAWRRLRQNNRSLISKWNLIAIG